MSEPCYELYWSKKKGNSWKKVYQKYFSPLELEKAKKEGIKYLELLEEEKYVAWVTIQDSPGLHTLYYDFNNTGMSIRYHPKGVEDTQR